MISLKGRVAVVTGATGELGESIVQRLAVEGMRVAALARNREKLQVLKDDLKTTGYFVRGYMCDFQIESEVRAVFKSIEEDLGAVTVLINNAAVSNETPLRDMNLEYAETILTANVIGVLSCTREALKSIKNHLIDHGHIVNINSFAGHTHDNQLNLSVYHASKHALASLCHGFRNELKSSKIRMTSISSGIVQITASASSNLQHLLPSDVADAVVYALSAPLNVNVSEIILEGV